MIVDTHCHLDDPRFDEDIELVLDRAISNGVERFIIPGADPKTLDRALELSQKHQHIYFAVGVHPYDAINYDRHLLKPYAEDEKCIAIGECGLDYYRLPSDPKEIEIEKRLQKEVFIDQVEWAKELKKPLIVHIRDSSRDSMDILNQYAGDSGGVLHCYNGDEELLRLVDKNFYYGLGGVLTFKNAKKLIAIYPKIPQDRLLIETDAPYLTPHPHRGERNEPLHTKFIAEKMSLLSDIGIEEIESITTRNAYTLFGI